MARTRFVLTRFHRRPHLNFLIVAAALMTRVSPAAAAENPAAQDAWRAQVTTVEIPCSDGAAQPALWYAPADAGPKPLLVSAHTWSSSYDTAGAISAYAAWCINRGWAWVHPDFRGPNRTPAAMGSDRAVQDIVEAVAWAKRQTAVDESRIYLIGASGGGHMSLQMAGRHPEIWAGVSAWVGISDIAQWYEELEKSGKPYHYLDYIKGALGGEPLQDPPRKAEAWKRSPLSSLHRARAVPLDINHGRDDAGVPFTHALRAFNAVVPEADRLDKNGMNAFLTTRELPAGWATAGADASYGAKKPLFRKVAGNTRVTVFDGGHEMVYLAAFNWLAKQRKSQPALWDVTDFIKLDTEGAESEK